MFSNIYQDIQKREILYEFDVRFRTKAWIARTKHALAWPAGTTVHQQQTIYWILNLLSLVGL